MKSSSRLALHALAVRTAVAVAAVAACSAASAVPSFTFNPAGAGLTGAPFTADGLIVSDFATVTSTSTGFTETGYLTVASAQMGGMAAATPGLGSAYTLYIAFNAAGTNMLPAGGGVQFGNLTKLDYTLYGYNGSFAFSPTAAPSAAASVVLGSGSLVSGTFYGTTMGNSVTSATATANSLTFAKSATAGTFFTSPASFYNLAQASFTNDTSTIVNTATGFTVNGGGGSVHFVAAPVPEPETYALLLGGLAAVGFVARRRNNG